jgi:uncharacterized UPF0160 family protein
MKIKKVGTHSGTFHADDVIAYIILDELYGPLELVRSRDEIDLSGCDLVFDVGGGKYDHHTNDKEYRENGIPFAAAGLVWRDFGKELLLQKGIPSNSVDRIFTYIDEKYIQGLDAIDNGVRFKREILIPELPSDIQRFNPKWNRQDDENEQFFKAVNYARISFLNLIDEQMAILDAEKVIETAYAIRKQKEIIELEQYCPWLQPLLRVDQNEEVLFVVYPDKRRGYMIQVVPLHENTFEARKQLPKEWAGLDQEKLNSVIGIEDAIFAHPARFIAGAMSKESITKMASLAVKDK